MFAEDDLDRTVMRVVAFPLSPRGTVVIPVKGLGTGWQLQNWPAYRVCISPQEQSHLHSATMAFQTLPLSKIRGVAQLHRPTSRSKPVRSEAYTGVITTPKI